MRNAARLLALPMCLAACGAPNSGTPLPEYSGASLPGEDGTPYEDAEPLDPADATGQCGDVHYVDMTLTGYVVDDHWQPVSGLDVWLEERTWTPLNSHGEGLTDDTGRFHLELTGLPIVEGCWGIGPQFYVVSELGTLSCEVPANMHLVVAWLDESLEADISGYPCVLVAP